MAERTIRIAAIFQPSRTGRIVLDDPDPLAFLWIDGNQFVSYLHTSGRAPSWEAAQRTVEDFERGLEARRDEVYASFAKWLLSQVDPHVGRPVTQVPDDEILSTHARLHPYATQLRTDLIRAAKDLLDHDFGVELTGPSIWTNFVKRVHAEHKRRALDGTLTLTCFEEWFVSSGTLDGRSLIERAFGTDASNILPKVAKSLSLVRVGMPKPAHLADRLAGEVLCLSAEKVRLTRFEGRSV
jgi:hypothetical protein